MDRLSLSDIPGPIDFHVHIKSPEAFAQLAATGIVAVRDAGMRENVIKGFSSRRPVANGPLVISCVWALYKRGGYGAPFGVAVENERAIASEIVGLRDAGAGIIKVMASGVVSLEKPGIVTPGGFCRDELAFIVQEAGRYGLGVMAHANGEEAITAASYAGVRSIEHGFFMTEAALEIMARRGTFWTPTVGALARAADKPETSPEIRASIDGLIDSHLAMIRFAREIGVALAVGTDCILPHPRYREAYEAELAYFERAGLSRGEVRAIAGDAGLLGI